MNSIMRSTMAMDSAMDSGIDAPAQAFDDQPEALRDESGGEAYASARPDPDDIPPMTKRQLWQAVSLRSMPGETYMERLRYATALCLARGKRLKRRKAQRAEAHPCQEAVAEARRGTHPASSLQKEERHDC